MINEFKKFITRGNLADMALGFTVGAAFTGVARSLVDDLVMPVVGVLIGNVDFQDYFLVLSPGSGSPPFVTLEQANAAGATTLNYGLFINNVIALVIVGLAMFFAIRSLNRLRDEFVDDDGMDDVAPSEPDLKKCRYCRTMIPYRATKCPNCTSDLGTAARVPNPA